MNDFSKLSRIVLTSVAVVSVTGLIVSMFFGERFSSYESFRNDSYSYSAIGHRLFYELALEDPDLQFQRTEEEDRVYGEKTTIFLEPKTTLLDDRRELGNLIWNDLYSAILVLPKRVGYPDDDGKFIVRHSLIEEFIINDLLTELGGEGGVLRGIDPGAVTINALDMPEPAIESPIQLLPSDFGEPIYAYENGVLVTHLQSETYDFYVVSDPDIFANHGLMEPSNVGFISRLLETVPKPIELDETYHGYRKKPSFLRLITTFPFSIITIHFILLILLLTWAGLGQFGTRRSETVAIDYGPRGLIENTVVLFEPEHAAHLAEKYVWQTVRSVADSVNAPEHLGRRALLEWLDDLANRRGSTENIADLVRDTEQMAMDLKRWTPKDVVQTVQGVNRWKMEIMNGR